MTQKYAKYLFCSSADGKFSEFGIISLKVIILKKYRYLCENKRLKTDYGF